MKDCPICFRPAGKCGRRIACGVLAVLIVLLGAAPCLAAAPAEPVRVAVIDYPNYLQMHEDGTISGYAYEYLMEIQQYTGWQYEFVEMSFTDAAQALTDGEIDLVAGSQYTEGRAQRYDYSDRDMGEGGSVLCVLPDDMRYCYNDFAAYDGIKIAGLTGSVRIEQTKEKLAQYGANAVLIEYDTDEESKAALERGEVDAVLMSTIRCESQYKILARINTSPLYFCTNKQRPELKTALDDAMEQIHLEYPYYEEDLDEKYYGGVPIQLAFTQAELEYIASADPIVAAAADDLVPVEYYSDQDQAFHGVVPDAFALIAAYSGLSFRFVSRTDEDTLLAQLESGEVQVLASVANDSNVAARWGVELTTPYFDNSVAMIINSGEGNQENTDGTVAVRSGYPFLEQIARAEGYTNFAYLDTFDACIRMVNEAEATLTLIPSNGVDAMIRRTSYENLSAYLVPDSYQEFSIGVSETADPLLVSILNKSIASITREQQTELLVQNLITFSNPITLRGFLAAHRMTVLLSALAAAFVIIVGASCLAVSRQRTNRKLRTALEKADAASVAKTDFLARMSHDMRTPMNGILGLSYLMEDQTDIDAMKKELPQLREAGEYLLQLINDVLDVNKVESGQIELHPKVCDEEQLFASIISLVSPQIEKKNIQFRFVKTNIHWKPMLLDEQRVKQIFVNLLGNATKFTPEGGRIEFVMELVSEDEHMIRDRFIIRDNGIGMTEAFLPKVFEPFAQENRMVGSVEGTGLGLAIVKRLVELMGGSISVKSKVNEGTEFTVYLNFPLAMPEETAAVSAPKPVRIPAGTKILLCEDHSLNAQIATRLLEKQGAEVTWKQNGLLGVEEFSRSAPGSYDAVLMDIRMPVMDGLAAARAIRALDRPDAGTVPMIAMTANAFEEDIRASREAGMNAHLAKPISVDELYQTLSDLLHGGGV